VRGPSVQGLSRVRSSCQVDPSSPPDTERGPCPRCGESTALAGRVCPHCDASLLVDVVTSAPVPDARRGYRAARELAALGNVRLAKLKDRLAQAGGAVVLSAVTRETARKAKSVLESSGVAPQIVPTPLFGASADVPELDRSMIGDRLPLTLLIVSAALAAVGVVFFVRRYGSPQGAALLSQQQTPATRSTPAASETPSFHDLAAAALRSTAALRCGLKGGAGFFVTPELVVTNAHVLCDDRSSLEVTLHDGRKLPASIQASDDWLDVALLRVPGAVAPPLALGDATKLEPGDVVLLIGSPLGLDFTVSRAIVSHPRRNHFGIAFIQFDANVNPGNSGGPLLDGRGRAVGIVSMMMLHARGLALALPVNYLRDLPGASLPIGDPPPDFAEWRRVLASVRDQDAAEAAAAREAYRRPGLGGAAVDPEGRLFAFVVVLGQPAGTRPYRFRIRRDGRVLCSPTGLVDTWGPSSQRLMLPDDPRLTRWLAKIDLGAELYSGSAQLSTGGCPETSSLVGAELELDGADPGAARTLIDRVRMVE
jgi:serine protease Do